VLRPILLFLILFALPLQAEENNAFRFGDDAYLAGRTASNIEDGIDSLFALADRVTSGAALSSSAYLAGRRVTITAPVAVNLYAGGATITLAAPIGGDAILIGDTLSVSGPVTGNLRAMGNEIDLSAPVGGSALLGGQEIYVNASIGGDLGLAGETVEFGPNTTVAGTLHIYGHEAGDIEVPTSVVAADRIVWHEEDQWRPMMSDHGTGQTPSFWSRIRSFVSTIIVVGILASILAAIAPDFLAAIRVRALESPLRTGWIGFIALSASLGSLLLLAVTGFGLLLVPVALMLGSLLALVGYLVGVYVLGVGLAKILGRAFPDSLGARATAAFIGATGIALIGLIPLLGWLVTLALALLGAGGLMVRLFAPGFYTELR